jgi:hypothetical protein
MLADGHADAVLDIANDRSRVGANTIAISTWAVLASGLRR